MSSRGWLAVIVGSVLLVAGLVALAVPVFLDEYDSYGIAIGCGNGFHSQLTQAAADDRVDQCMRTLALRRAEALPAASLGAVILTAALVAWARRGAAAPNSATAPDTSWASTHPDSAIHDAAVLDRRESHHRQRPSNTTL